METRVYRLRYAASEEVVKALGVVVPQERIGIDARTNQLTILANVLEHQNIEEIIARLDRRMPQINIEARVEEISLAASKELGITWEFPHFSLGADLTQDLNPCLTWLTPDPARNGGKGRRVLANPNISPRTAGRKIFIGDRLPVITSESGMA